MSSEDKEDKKDVPAPANKELRTLVGVPVLEGARAANKVPPPSPSSTLLEPPKPEGAPGDGGEDGSESNTGVDVKALSNAEAERVLQWTGFTQEEIPTVNSPKGSSKATQVGMPAFMADPRATFRGIAPPGRSSRPPPPPIKSTTIRAGAPGPANSPRPPSVKPPPPKLRTPPPSKGRSTLVMDAGAPPEADPLSSTGERPPIVVPAAGALAPKAVTQPPPWGEGSVHVTGIPHAAALPGSARGARDTSDDPVEELSGSVLLPDDVEATRRGSDVVEELSGSILLPDESALPRSAPRKSVPPKVPASRPAASPTQHGHGAIVAPHAANAPTKESPVFPPVPMSAAPPAVVAATLPFAVPVPLAQPPIAQPSPPPPVAVLTATPAPVVALSPPTPMMPMPIDNVVEPPGIIDPTLPPGVPVPPPPDIITHPAWPPSIKPPSSTSSPPSSARPFGAPSPSSSSPPGTTRVPDSTRPVDSTGELARLIPHTSFLHTRPQWFLPVVVAGGVVVSIGLLGLLVSGVSKSEDLTVRASPAVARAASSIAERSTNAALKMPSTPAVNTVVSAALASSVECSAGASVRVLAPRAVVGTGVEALAFDGALAVGFASSPNEGVALLLDPSSLAVTSSAKTKSLDAIHRLSPKMTAKKNAAAVADADRRTDKLRGRRTIVSRDGAIDVGATGDALVAGPDGVGAGGGTALWKLDGDGAVEALRGVSIASGSDSKETTWAFAFRRAGAIWFGAAGSDNGGKTMLAKGALSHVQGLGERVGSPAIAASGDSIMIAWADRKSDADPWSLRTVRFKAGDTPSAASTFVVPAGGLGQHAMSPGLAGLAGGRFLLVWTEGPVAKRQVRGQTLSASGAVLGAPLTISAADVYAGQGQVAVLPDGRGVVAFLGADSQDAKKFEVMATPITCPP
jgi:hypothetical protein